MIIHIWAGDIFMKRNPLVTFLLILFFLSFNLNIKITSSELNNTSIIAIDNTTKRILYEENSTEVIPIDNATKIMTAILVLEYCNLSELVNISDKAARTEGPSIWLEAGEKQTMENLLYALMLSEANDAAVAIAEHIAGSVDEFAHMMTDKAKQIGANNTNFKNPHGLIQDKHISTVHDLSLIANYAIKKEKFKEIIQTPIWELPWHGHTYNKIIKNNNKLENKDTIRMHNRNYTGNIIISFKEEKDFKFTVITFTKKNDFNRHMDTINYVLDNYEIKDICSKGQLMKTVHVRKGRQNRISLLANSDYYIPFKKTGKENISLNYKVPDSINAPIIQGEEYAGIEILLNNKHFGEIKLIASENVAKRDIKESFYKIMLYFLNKMMYYIL